MRRFFGGCMFVCAIIAFAYGVESNAVGAAVFGAFTLITGFFWLTSPDPKRPADREPPRR